MSLMVVAAILLIQEPSPVLELMKKIDGKDPAACFRAIADLADLGPERRAEIEKGAPALPAFYRDALLEELRIPKSQAPRVTLGGEPRTAEKHIDKIAELAGMKFEWDQRRRENEATPNPPYVETLKNAPALEALAGLMARRGLQVTLSAAPRRQWLAPADNQVWACGHRSAAIVNQHASWTRRMDFSGPVEWHLKLSFNGLTAHGESMIGWSWPRLVEAVGDDGTVLKRDDSPDNSSVKWSDEPHYSTVPSLTWGFWLSLKAPERVRTLQRLRFVAVALCAEEMGTLEIKTKAGGGSGVGSIKDLDAKLLDTSQEGGGRLRIRLRVKATTMTAMDLFIRPVTAQATVTGLPGHSWVTSEIVDGAVEYGVQWAPSAPLEGDPTTVLEKVCLTLPVKVVERPVHVEFRDLPLWRD